MPESSVQLLPHSTLRSAWGEENYSNCLEMDHVLVCLLQNMSSMRASTQALTSCTGKLFQEHLLNEWVNECVIPVTLLTLLSHHIRILLFVTVEKLEGRKKTASGQELVPKPWQSRKRPRGGNALHALPRPAPTAPRRPARGRAARVGSAPRSGAGSPSCLSAPRLPGPHARAPRRPGPGAGRRPGAPGVVEAPPGPSPSRPRAAPPSARTHRPRPALLRRRGPGRAAAGAGAGGEAGGSRPGAPGPCRRRLAPGALPLRLRPRGAKIRRRAPAGRARPGSFRRRAGERRAPRGPGEAAGRGRCLPAWSGRREDARS